MTVQRNSQVSESVIQQDPVEFSSIEVTVRRFACQQHRNLWVTDRFET